MPLVLTVRTVNNSATREAAGPERTHLHLSDPASLQTEQTRCPPPPPAPPAQEGLESISKAKASSLVNFTELPLVLKLCSSWQIY